MTLPEYDECTSDRRFLSLNPKDFMHHKVMMMFFGSSSGVRLEFPMQNPRSSYNLKILERSLIDVDVCIVSFQDLQASWEYVS
jgi:hypothetical protein